MKDIRVGDPSDDMTEACSGKATLPFDTARRVVERKLRAGERGLSTYHCGKCQGWHIGHSFRPQGWKPRH